MTTNIQKAREWAEWAGKRRGVVELHANALAAAEVIQSLPEQWIDVEKLREALEGCDKMTYPYEVIEHIEKTLFTPPLQTLAELIEAGDKPEGYQWMQARVFPTATTLGVITGVDGYARSAIILFADGMAKNVPWGHITPLPDLPKLEWPSLSVSGESEPVSVETEDVTEESRTDLPRPEDVPAGEPWIVQHEDREWIGCRNDSGTRFPWLVIGRDYHDFDYCYDVDITLVSRLVPEVKP